MKFFIFLLNSISKNNFKNKLKTAKKYFIYSSISLRKTRENKYK